MFSYDGIAVLKSENDHIPHRSMIHRNTREENCFADMGGIAMQKLKTPHSQALVTIGSVLLSALLQTYVIQTMMQPTGLLSGGFTGLAILLDRIAGVIGFPFSVSAGILMLNIPLALLCYRRLSKRFTLYSSIQFLSSSIFLQLFHFQPLVHDLFLQVIFGGFLYGFSAVIALRGNASTGGTDFIALYVSNRLGKSIWGYVFFGNTLLLCVSGLLFGWLYAGYSILFQYITTRTIEMFYHRYERLTIEIMTRNRRAVSDAYIHRYKHGITIIPAYGGYHHNRIYLLQTVVSSYEVYDIVQLVRKTDPEALINVMKTEQFYGTFYQQPLE